MSEQEIIERLVKEVEQLKNMQQAAGGNLPLYRIGNANYPASLTANQNNYDPGNYDIIFLEGTAARNISGFSGGTEGRMLFIRIIGSFAISLLNLSGLSLAANQIVTRSGATLALAVGGTALLIYQGSTSRWIVWFSVP